MTNLKPRRLALALLLSTLSLPALALAPCNPCDPISTPKIYAAGVAYTPNWQAVMWVDGVRTDLPPLVNAYNAGAREANSIFVVENFETGENDVYVGGAANMLNLPTAAVETSAMIWKNGEVYSQIPSISTTYANQYAGVNSLFVENGNVYSGGYTDKKGSVSTPQGSFADMKPIVWKNGVQSLLPLHPTAYRGELRELFVRDGNVYAIGNHHFTMENTPSNPYGLPELWVNGVLVPGDNPPFIDYQALFATNTTLYVAGGIPNLVGHTQQRLAAYAYRPRAWGAASNEPNSGTGFTHVFLPSNNNLATVTSLYVVGTRVYSVGWELRPSGKYVAKLWINQSPVDLSLESESAVATSVFVHGNDVYVGGSINNIVNQRPKAVVWKNGQMIDFNGGELGSHITSIYVK